jgi:galactose mutarotase-like enzyme
VLPDGPIDLLGNTEDCYLTGERTRIPGGRYAFDEPGLDRTYMLDLSGIPPAARVVSLTDPDGFGVRVRCPDFPHVGLWSDAGAPFLCIEPWQGMDDERVQVAFDRKFGMVLLPPGATDVRRASIEVL